MRPARGEKLELWPPVCRWWQSVRLKKTTSFSLYVCPSSKSAVAWPLGQGENGFQVMRVSFSRPRGKTGRPGNPTLLFSRSSTLVRKSFLPSNAPLLARLERLLFRSHSERRVQKKNELARVNAIGCHYSNSCKSSLVLRNPLLSGKVPLTRARAANDPFRIEYQCLCSENGGECFFFSCFLGVFFSRAVVPE